MTITSKYPGRCRVCGERYQVGERINWIRGAQSAHAGCVLKATQESTLPVPEMDALQDGIPALRWAQNDTYEEDYGRALVASEGE